MGLHCSRRVHFRERCRSIRTQLTKIIILNVGSRLLIVYNNVRIKMIHVNLHYLKIQKWTYLHREVKHLGKIKFHFIFGAFKSDMLKITNDNIKLKNIFRFVIVRITSWQICVMLPSSDVSRGGNDLVNFSPLFFRVCRRRVGPAFSVSVSESDNFSRRENFLRWKRGKPFRVIFVSIALKVSKKSIGYF